MAKKPGKESKGTARGARARIIVEGDISAGRDVVLGDQYNDFRQQVAQIASPEEFIARAQELQAMLAEIKGQPGLSQAEIETLEVVAGQVEQVIEEAQKPQPLSARITATLTGAKAVIDSLGETVKSAVGLGAVLAGLGQIALKVFGGG